MIDTNRVRIFDTTLRDGEQSPGCSMNTAEKLRVAQLLESMGVDVIEAGFPIASPGDFEAVRAIAAQTKDSVVAGLARCHHADIDRAAEAVRGAARPRIHTFVATSPLHMRVKLGLDPERVVERIADCVARARNLVDDVEWSCEDGSRSEIDFLCRCVETAIDAGATTINVPDTVGYATPDEYAALFRALIERVPNIDRAVLSAHTHNDLGLAVANALAAVGAGVRQVECTVNGIGERAGNASLEEIVMALRTRADALPYRTGIDSTKIMAASRLVSAITGFHVQPNKAIVGANAFAHESGIHQDGMLKDAQTYEIMRPEDVGLSRSNLVLGKHSGRHAFKDKLKSLGYELGDNALRDAFDRFKQLADKKKEVFDEDIVALVDEEIHAHEQRITVKRLMLHCGTGITPTCALTLDVEGEAKSAVVEGAGPVDAVFNAIKAIVPHEATLQLYQIHAVTQGTDAQAEVSVRLEEEGRSSHGQAADEDTMVASARAYVAALNRLLLKRGRHAPAAIPA